MDKTSIWPIIPRSPTPTINEYVNELTFISSSSLGPRFIYTSSGANDGRNVVVII